MPSVLPEPMKHRARSAAPDRTVWPSRISIRATSLHALFRPLFAVGPDAGCVPSVPRVVRLLELSPDDGAGQIGVAATNELDHDRVVGERRFAAVEEHSGEIG